VRFRPLEPWITSLSKPDRDFQIRHNRAPLFQDLDVHTPGYVPGNVAVVAPYAGIVCLDLYDYETEGRYDLSVPSSGVIWTRDLAVPVLGGACGKDEEVVA
jgi:hypothetical protein